MSRLDRWVLRIVMALGLLLVLAGIALSQDAQTTGSITANGQTIVLSITNRGGGVVQLAGSWTGTIQFEGTVDNTNWFAMPVQTIATSPTAVTSATAVGRWSFAPAGYLAVRVRASAAITGSVGVTMRAATASAGSSGGGGGGGTVTQGASNGGSDPWAVTCTSGCAGGTSDVDDNSVAAGQTTGLQIGLGYAYDSNVTNTWKRLLFAPQGQANSLAVAIAPDQTAFVVNIADSINQGLLSNGAGALQVDGSAVTQPVSWSGQTITATQATGTNLHTVVDSGTITTITNPVTVTDGAGALNVIVDSGTLTAVTAITNALPAGNNNIGDVDIVTFPDNEPFNLQQVAGTTADTNSGVKSAGTLRVVLATDQPQLTNKLLVTPDSVALPANQSVNVNQFGGSAVVTGTGAGGAGIPRVTVSNDSSLAANQSVNMNQVGGTNVVTGGANGTQGVGGINAQNASITQNPLLGASKGIADGTQPTAVTDGNLSQNTGSLDGAQFVRFGGPVRWTCGLNAIAASLTQCQAAPGAGLRLYLTGVYVQTTTTTSGTYSIQTGTGSNCGTGTAALFPVSGTGNRFNAPITSNAMAPIPFWVPIAAPVNSAICLIGVATNTISVQMVGYTAP